MESLGKQVLIAAESAGARGQVFEHEASTPEEIENHLGLGNFEWIPSDPINKVMPPRHAANCGILCPGFDVAHGVQGGEGNQGVRDLSGTHGTDHERHTKRTRKTVVDEFNQTPEFAQPALVVVNGDQ